MINDYPNSWGRFAPPANKKRYNSQNISYRVDFSGKIITSSKAKKSMDSGSEGRIMPKTKLTLYNYTFDKGRLKSLVSWSLKTYGEAKTIILLENLKKTGFEYATKAGISLGVEDLKIPPKKALLLYEAEEISKKARIQHERSQITGVERFQRLIDTWHRTSEQLKQEVIDYFEKTDVLNPVYMMAFSGARGNISQVRQLVGMRGLMSDPKGQIIDYPIRSNFKEGLTITEYIISSYGARKGIVDTALRTANAGYLTRRLVDVAQHVVISNYDCGTRKGVFLSDIKEGNKTIFSLQARLLGRVLARNVYKPEQVSTTNLVSQDEVKEPNSVKFGSRNQEIGASLAAEIPKYYSKVFVRSALTCETKKQICQLCYGWSLAQGNLVSIGEAVGIVAAQSIGEPGTQLTMRTFHTGGVFSGDTSDQIRAPYNGIVQYVDQIAGVLTRTPEGKVAFLTKVDGSIFVINSNTDSQTAKKFKIPGYTLLYFKSGDRVSEKQVIAQISTIARQANMREDASLVVKSPLQGQFMLENLKIQESLSGPKFKPINSKAVGSAKKSTDDVAINTKLSVDNNPENSLDGFENKFNPLLAEKELSAWNWGYAWVLSCKLYKIPIFGHTNKIQYIPKPGDFVDEASVMAKVNWLLPSQGGFKTYIQHGTEVYNKKNGRMSFLDKLTSISNVLTKSLPLNTPGAYTGPKLAGRMPGHSALSFENTQITKPHLIFNKVKIQKKLFSLDIKSIFYNKIGYFLNTSSAKNTLESETGETTILFLPTNLGSKNNNRINGNSLTKFSNSLDASKGVGSQALELGNKITNMQECNREAGAPLSISNMFGILAFVHGTRDSISNTKLNILSGDRTKAIQFAKLSGANNLLDYNNPWARKVLKTQNTFALDSSVTKFYKGQNSIEASAPLTPLSNTNLIFRVSLESGKTSNLKVTKPKSKERFYGDLKETTSSSSEQKMINGYGPGVEKFVRGGTSNNLVFGNYKAKLPNSYFIFQKGQIMPQLRWSSNSKNNLVISSPLVKNIPNQKLGRKLGTSTTNKSIYGFPTTISGKKANLIAQIKKALFVPTGCPIEAGAPFKHQLVDSFDKDPGQGRFVLTKKAGTNSLLNQKDTFILALKKDYDHSAYSSSAVSQIKYKIHKNIKKPLSPGYVLHNRNILNKYPISFEVSLDAFTSIWKERALLGRIFCLHANNYSASVVDILENKIQTNLTKNLIYKAYKSTTLQNSSLKNFSIAHINPIVALKTNQSEHYVSGDAFTNVAKNVTNWYINKNPRFLPTEISLQVNSLGASNSKKDYGSEDYMSQQLTNSKPIYISISQGADASKQIIKSTNIEKTLISRGPIVLTNSVNPELSVAGPLSPLLTLTQSARNTYIERFEKQALNDQNSLGPQRSWGNVIGQSSSFLQKLSSFKKIRNLPIYFKKSLPKAQLDQKGWSKELSRKMWKLELTGFFKINNLDDSVLRIANVRARNVKQSTLLPQSMGSQQPSGYWTSWNKAKTSFVFSKQKNSLNAIAKVPNTRIFCLPLSSTDTYSALEAREGISSTRAQQLKLNKTNSTGRVAPHNKSNLSTFFITHIKPLSSVGKANVERDPLANIQKLTKFTPTSKIKPKGDNSKLNSISFSPNTFSKLSEKTWQKEPLFKLNYSGNASLIKQLVASSKTPRSQNAQIIKSQKQLFNNWAEGLLKYLSKQTFEVSRKAFGTNLTKKKGQTFKLSKYVPKKKQKTDFLTFSKSSILGYYNQPCFEYNLAFNYKNYKLGGARWSASLSESNIPNLRPLNNSVLFKTDYHVSFDNLNTVLWSLASTSFISNYSGEVLENLGWGTKNYIQRTPAASVEPLLDPHEVSSSELLSGPQLPQLRWGKSWDKNKTELVLGSENPVWYEKKQIMKNNENRGVILTSKDLVSYRLLNSAKSVIKYPYSSESLSASSETKSKLITLGGPGKTSHNYKTVQKLWFIGESGRGLHSQTNKETGAPATLGHKTISPYNKTSQLNQIKKLSNRTVGSLVLKGDIALEFQPSVNEFASSKTKKDATSIYKYYNTSGQIVAVNNHRITVRKAQPLYISERTLFHSFHGDFVIKNEPIVTLIYQKLKTGDIIQGIPKVEQFFEARTTKRGRLFRENLPNLLKGLFLKYYFTSWRFLKQIDSEVTTPQTEILNVTQKVGSPNASMTSKTSQIDYTYLAIQWAVKQSFYKIQQIAVDGVLRVYRSQGVSISDKHLEIVVKQMTTKVRIISGGQTGFFPGELVDLDFVQTLNNVLIKKVLYEPVILGITKASLQVDSFLSAASFQQTSRILSQSALVNKKDFLKGVKENVIVGNLIPTGTGYLVSLFDGSR